MASLFSSAVKSLTATSLSSLYIISPTTTSTAGPWRIHDCKKKSTGQPYTAFIFDRKSLDAPSSSAALRSNAGLRAAQDEVVERLKKEVGFLARLRHPSILELAEPVEESRTGLMFITESVMGSLQSVLGDDADRRRDRERRRDMEIDELEIQKGLLQVAKGLEFLHESAGLVHGNLTPEAVFVNAKSDWKLAAFSFSTSHSTAANPTSTPIDLVGLASSHDPRLPSNVQLSLDYASPDLLIDSSITPAIDLFSLGLLIIAIYNSPHESPLKSHNSPSTFRRLFSSSTSIPSVSNNFLSSRPLPKDLVEGVLPRLITRRPATRMNAIEFQEAGYFDNILVSTIRFLDEFPGKSANEKSAFMRGLPKVLPQFPTSVSQRKILPMLVEELKDRGELLPFTLAALLTVLESLPPGSRIISEKVLPAIRNTFDLNSSKKEATATPSSVPRPGTERDGRDAALAVLLEKLSILRDKCNSSEFRDDIIPLYLLALDSPTSHLQDLALKSLPDLLPKLDFPTLKNSVFPVVSTVFTKTSSLSIKITCLDALRVLCGGKNKNADDFSGKKDTREDGVSLDRYTVQEKVVPLIKGIKTKEPGVMMAALEVYVQIGLQVDETTLAIEVIPALWGLALGPLLNLEQFQSFIKTIKFLSTRIETEHTRKLQESATSSQSSTSTVNSFVPSAGVMSPTNASTPAVSEEANFAELVFGKKSSGTPRMGDVEDPWGTGTVTARVPSPRVRTNPQQQPKKASGGAAFAWSTPSPISPVQQPNMGIDSISTLQPKPPSNSRTVTPDVSISSFGTLQPQSANRPASSMSSFNQTLQPSRPGMTTSNSMTTLSSGIGNLSMSSQPLQPASFSRTQPSSQTSNTGGTIDWSSATIKPSFPTPPKPNNTPSYSANSFSTIANSFSTPLQPQKKQTNNNTHPTILAGQIRQQPAPVNNNTQYSGWGLPPPPPPGGSLQKNQTKSGLDAFESLL